MDPWIPFRNMFNLAIAITFGPFLVGCLLQARVSWLLTRVLDLGSGLAMLKPPRFQILGIALQA